MGTSVPAESAEQVQQVLLKYASGLDHADFDVVASCFWEDVESEYDGTRLPRGVESVITYTRGRSIAPKCIMHVMNPPLLGFDEQDSIHSESYGVVYIVELVDGLDRFRVKGIRYVDVFVERDGEWRIANRKHMPMWETVAADLKVATF
jgi:hypothetical protein